MSHQHNFFDQIQNLDCRKIVQSIENHGILIFFQLKVNSNADDAIIFSVGLAW
jgi:hypothetical protein